MNQVKQHLGMIALLAVLSAPQSAEAKTVEFVEEQTQEVLAWFDEPHSEERSCRYYLSKKRWASEQVVKYHTRVIQAQFDENQTKLERVSALMEAYSDRIILLDQIASERFDCDDAVAG